MNMADPPTGTKSKKYEEAVKAVTEKWCRDHLEEFESGKQDKTAKELLAARQHKLCRLAKLKADLAPTAPPAKKRRIKRDEEEGQESKKEQEKEKEFDEKKGVLVQKPPPSWPRKKERNSGQPTRKRERDCRP